MAYNKYVAAALSFTALLVATGCGHYVEKAKYDALNKELSEYKSELVKAQTKLDEKPKHNYSLHQTGAITHRFDSMTGQTCVQLAPRDYWKRLKPEESCGAQDVFESVLEESGKFAEASCVAYGKFCNKVKPAPAPAKKN